MEKTKTYPYVIQKGIDYAQDRIAQGINVEHYTKVLQKLLAYSDG